ncbi:hypothetical protein IW261DRAFT_1000172 [Armillaria novae-zelandiae]|uniref:Uncharacterized protein n=1 Tax=Armillaria novae-zelandiae TaxID=153914 RepID=A0AA39NS50_9AGAR|nr:hypothetical protein IW261DRAFT_1000172 [Armillaria novae-zelandiae]
MRPRIEFLCLPKFLRDRPLVLIATAAICTSSRGSTFFGGGFRLKRLASTGPSQPEPVSGPSFHFCVLRSTRVQPRITWDLDFHHTMIRIKSPSFHVHPPDPWLGRSSGCRKDLSDKWPCAVAEQHGRASFSVGDRMFWGFALPWLHGARPYRRLPGSAD